MITFGEWTPDQADLLNPGVTVATNVMPSANGYHSMSSFVEYSNAATGTIKGIFAAKDSASNTKLFAGDAAQSSTCTPSDNDLDSVTRWQGMIWLTPSAGASCSATTSSLLAAQARSRRCLTSARRARLPTSAGRP